MVSGVHHELAESVLLGTRTTNRPSLLPPLPLLLPAHALRRDRQYDRHNTSSAPTQAAFAQCRHRRAGDRLYGPSLLLNGALRVRAMQVSLAQCRGIYNWPSQSFWNRDHQPTFLPVLLLPSLRGRRRGIISTTVIIPRRRSALRRPKPYQCYFSREEKTLHTYGHLLSD